MTIKKHHITPLFMVLLFLLPLTPWAFFFATASINSNVAWLSICADRILDGIKMSQGCYDTNPPLSLIIYTPFVAISNITKIETQHILFTGMLCLTALSTITTHYLITKSKLFSKHEQTIFICAYLCSITIYTGHFFAEREHFIALTILPVILIQLAITNHLNIHNGLKYVILIIGSVTLLIKPHFGLIPLFMLVHRIYKHKNFQCIFKADFFILCAVSASYIIITIIFFNDFISEILPHILKHYIGYNDHEKTYQYTMKSLILVATSISMVLFISDTKQKDMLCILGVTASLTTLVYFLQMKGFVYHLMPFYALIFPILAVTGYVLIKQELKIKDHKAVTLALCALIYTMNYYDAPLNHKHPTHNDYKNNAISQYINENCITTNNCGFYITHYNMDIISQIAFYSPHTYATRFPTFWFLSNKKLQKINNHFIQMVATDINTHKPKVLFDLKADNKNDKTLFEQLMKNGLFADAIAKYEKKDTLSINRKVFYAGTKYDFDDILEWDIYIRKNNGDER